MGISKHFSLCFVSIIICFVLSVSIVFADDGAPEIASDPVDSATGSEVVSVEDELLNLNNKNPEILNLAKSIKSSTATTYDLDDIYNIIEECANALVEYDGSEFVSVTEYVHACLTGIASGLFNGSSQNPYLGTINSNIASIQAAVYGPAWDGSGVTNSLWNALQTLYSVNHADQLAQMAKQQGIIDALVGNTQYSISHKLDDLSSNLNNINWNQSTATIKGFSTTLNNAKAGTYDYTSGHIGFYVRISVPFNRCFAFIDPLPRMNGDMRGYIVSGLNLSYSSPIITIPNGWQSSIYLPIESRYSYSNGIEDLYLYYPNSSLIGSVNEYTSPYFYYILPNTQDYMNALSSYSNYLHNNQLEHIDNDLHSLSGGIDKLVQMYASDDELAAKQDQQDYEDQALDDFTGSGSAAAKGSDLTSAKQLSGSVKSGLNTGASVSDGLAVFNPNSSFFGWFSQSNYDMINTVYSPNRNNLRSSSSDQLDTSTYDQNYQEILNQLGGNR